MTMMDFLNIAGSTFSGCVLVGILAALGAERIERRKRGPK